jgi:hypothetical protein
MESPTKDQYMSEGDAEEVGAFTSGNVEDITELLSGTFIGKLRFYCPSLYFKLSSWERDFLEKSYPTTNLLDTENGGNQRFHLIVESPALMLLGTLWPRLILYF